MTSIHHDLDLMSQVDGWSTVTWRHKSLASADLHEAWHGVPAAPRPFRRLVRLVLGWHERARQRRALRQLDDDMRRDVGLCPDAARVEGQMPFWRP
jgi:uncharacterized protein YjiS (DUF1127 family)